MDDAVASAAALLPRENGAGHVFYEERCDRRIRVSSGGLREETRTASRGAAVVSRASCHVADPSARDLESAAAAAAAGSAPPDPRGSRAWRGGASEFEVGVPEELHSWLAAVIPPALRGRVQVTATLIEAIQKIWVGRPGLPVVTDRRASRRLEVVASVRTTGGEARATAERALTPGARLPDDLLPAAIERASDRAAASTRTPTPIPGWRTTRAVLAPGVGGVVVHELVGHALEADVVASGRSRLWTVSGAPFPLGLTIADDPRRGRAPWTVDDEGAPSRRVALIAAGRVAGRLTDRLTATDIGEVSSGHGRRSSYLERVLPRMGCTFVEPGDSDPAAIVASTDSGIYVRRLAAAETDPRIGRASFVVTDADLVEHGQAVPLVEPFPIVLDVVDSLCSIDAIGNDLDFDRCIGSCVRDGQPVASSVGAPTIRLGVVRAFSAR